MCVLGVSHQSLSDSGLWRFHPALVSHLHLRLTLESTLRLHYHVFLVSFSSRPCHYVCSDKGGGVFGPAAVSDGVPSLGGFALCFVPMGLLFLVSRVISTSTLVPFRFFCVVFLGTRSRA